MLQMLRVSGRGTRFVRALPVPLAGALLAAASCTAPTPATPATPVVTPAVPTPPAASAPAPGLRFSVALGAAVAGAPAAGRVLLVLAKDPAREPRTQVSARDATAQVFGVDVQALAAGQAVTIDREVLGYPVASLADLPAGDYVAQAVLQRYETFVRGDGHTVVLPADRGEGRDWTKAPGNLVSEPLPVHVDPAAGGELRLELTRVLPELPPVPDTKYLKHVQFQSERLTKFWGRPTSLGAIVLLPEGWESHPTAHYPLLIDHGHFQRELHGWRETPPDPGLPPVDLPGLARQCPNGHEDPALCAKLGYERLTQETAYGLFQKWTATKGKTFPRVIGVVIQHANPYYDDSYAVNSENVGPYGDAITYELIPYLEKTFRGLGPWARGMMGGSTGGWEALAAQVFYPDQYNGAVANCPDPIDFHAYGVVDLYRDDNAYFSEGPLRRTAQPASRDALGHVRSTLEQENLMELVLGPHSRSGGQWDIWQAVFSPVGADGYPQPVWDKRTGVIDRRVVDSWKEHFDLEHILERDWAKLGPQLRGKITINVGLSDTYFLNDAVYLVDDFLKRAQPPADAVVDYGPRDEHCWSGDHSTFNGQSRLTYMQRFAPKLVEHWLRTAPPGADVKSWRY
jgi:hypothetical protein